MDQFVSSVEGVVNSFLSNPVVQIVGRAIVIYLVALWLASAYWAFRDLQSRTANPIAPYVAAITIIFFTPALFLFALILYRLVRPPETVAEANERALAEESMLREMPVPRYCPNCQRDVEAEWLVCPSCRAQLRRACVACGKRIELDWNVCAWCGHDPAMPLGTVAPPALLAPERISRRRPAAKMAAGGAVDSMDDTAVGAPPLQPLPTQRGGGTSVRTSRR